MYFKKHFTPGNNSRCRKIITYAQLYADNLKEFNCTYISNEITNKSLLKPNITNAQRISNYLKINRGGSTQFGNYYLGEPVVFNYLGRVEGQPGGSGSPLINRF